MQASDGKMKLSGEGGLQREGELGDLRPRAGEMQPPTGREGEGETNLDGLSASEAEANQNLLPNEGGANQNLLPSEGGANQVGMHTEGEMQPVQLATSMTHPSRRPARRAERLRRFRRLSRRRRPGEETEGGKRSALAMPPTWM